MFVPVLRSDQGDATLPATPAHPQRAHLVLMLQPLLLALEHPVCSSRERFPTTQSTIKLGKRSLHAQVLHVYIQVTEGYPLATPPRAGHKSSWALNLLVVLNIGDAASFLQAHPI